MPRTIRNQPSPHLPWTHCKQERDKLLFHWNPVYAGLRTQGEPRRCAYHGAFLPATSGHRLGEGNVGGLVRVQVRVRIRVAFVMRTPVSLFFPKPTLKDSYALGAMKAPGLAATPGGPKVQSRIWISEGETTESDGVADRRANSNGKLIQALQSATAPGTEVLSAHTNQPVSILKTSKEHATATWQPFLQMAPVMLA